MTARRAFLWALILAILTVLAIFTIDGAVAASLQSAAKANRSLLGPIVGALEFLFAFEISKFATGAAIVVASLVMFAVPRWRAPAPLVLFVGATHLVTRLAAGVLKNVFLRARPGDASAGTFFVDGGSSFPSGHAAHFWALFFALAIAFPKLRIPALVLAIFVSMARVAVNDHYVGDVLASAAIAAAISGGFALLIRSRLPSSGQLVTDPRHREQLPSARHTQSRAARPESE